MEQNLVSQQDALKRLRELGYLGITHQIIKAAADGGSFRIYRPGKRKYYYWDSVIAWARQFSR